MASKGVGRCSFTILHNPHNNTSKNNLLFTTKFREPQNEQQQQQQQQHSWENGKFLVISNSKTLTQLPLMMFFFVVVRRVLRFQFKVFLIWCWMCFMVHRSTIFIGVFSPWFYEVAGSDELQMWLPRGNEDRVNHIDRGGGRGGHLPPLNFQIFLLLILYV